VKTVATDAPALASTYEQYLAALLAGDRRTCRAIFEAWLDREVELRVLYEGLVQRSLYDVGDRWERGQVSVATEHLATAITESMLNLVYPRLFSRPPTGGSAVVSALADEHHQIGAKIVADMFELHGWRGYFLGANTPLPDLLGLIRARRPDAVALSLTVYLHLDRLLEAVTAIRAEFPALTVLVGGQAFRWGGRERVGQIAGVRHLGSLAELENWIRSASPHG
jgi:methanogenic corrinoid protein MtbC1